MHRLFTTILLATTPLCAQWVSEGFLTPPVELKSVSAVDVAADGSVFVLHRGEPPILHFDPDGKYLGGFGEGMFEVAHGLRIDSKGTIWATDNKRHAIHHFNQKGKLLRTLGTLDQPGSGAKHFRSPDDIAFTSDGHVFVADAGNGRIVHLSPKGKYLGEWGQKGKEPGQFAAAHGIASGPNDRIFVADRGNNRVQVFDTAGKFLGQWTGFGNPFGVLAVGDLLLATDGDADTISHLRLSDGKLIYQWGDSEMLQLPHLMATGSDGRLYVTEVRGNRIQAFRRDEATSGGSE